MSKSDFIEWLLEAARADLIPAGESGLWHIKKAPWGGPDWVMACGANPKVWCDAPAGIYTKLFRYTDSTLHLGLGECVMDDTPFELKKHLNFMLRAHGQVLITGLGLGCVVRGALENPAVDKVTVIEKSEDVLKLVRPHMPEGPRLEIIKADALRFVHRTNQKFDCVWHDLWTDKDRGEMHLQRLHLQLILKGRKIATDFQGAWAFPRIFKRLLSRNQKVL